MLEDHQHQMNWERGQIDYLGVDSFDNILRKIDTVISQKEEEPAVDVVPPAPPGELGETEHEEMIARVSPRKREVISNAQLEECKRSPARRGAVGFRPRPKPMRGRGQQDHRERFMRVGGSRNQQPVSSDTLQALATGPSLLPTDS